MEVISENFQISIWTVGRITIRFR